MKLLLHVCCGPCLVYPLKALQEEGIEPRGFFYNPNIQPLTEFRRRLESLEGFAEKSGMPLIVRRDYPLEEWLRGVAFREVDRCRYCHHLRLSATARLAKKSGYSAFSTTLLYSRRQNHELIRDLGQAVGREAGVTFLYRDFREGWREGIEGSQSAGLYRQSYCGCIYSERDRFQDPPPKPSKR